MRCRGRVALMISSFRGLGVLSKAGLGAGSRGLVPVVWHKSLFLG